MADRDDANLRQFKSRSQQAKFTPSGPAMQPSHANPYHNVGVYVVFDSDFGTVTDQIDATRFKYTGTSPSVSPYEGMCARRTGKECMTSGFQYRRY